MRKVLLVVIVALMAITAIVIIDRTTERQSQIVGAVCVAIGVPLLVVSRIHLGRAFAIAPKATTLVTGGVYARIPHPMYTFLDLALLGLVVALRSRWLVVAWLALVAVHAWEARREARVLEAKFGDAYRKYRTHTWW